MSIGHPLAEGNAVEAGFARWSVFASAARAATQAVRLMLCFKAGTFFGRMARAGMLQVGVSPLLTIVGGLLCLPAGLALAQGPLTAPQGWPAGLPAGAPSSTASISQRPSGATPARWQSAAHSGAQTDASAQSLGAAPKGRDGAKALDEVEPGGRALSALVAEAMVQSPLIAAAQAHWSAETKTIIQASTLPDPEVGASQLSMGGISPAAGYGSQQLAMSVFSVTQPVPWPTKLTLKARRARREAEYARHQYEARRREVAREVREAYLELFYYQQRLALLRESRDELDRLRQTAEARYRVGEAQQQDVIRAQTERTAVLEQLALTERAIGQGQAELKTLLGREQDSGEIPVGRLRPSALKAGEAELRELALAASPRLKQAKAQQARETENLRLAKEGYKPDFTVGYMFMKPAPNFQNMYFLQFGATVPLYFWRKQTPAIEQASAELGAARLTTYATRLDLTGAVEKEWIGFTNAEQVIAIYRDGLVPQARAGYASALAAYRVARVDFQTVLSAFIEYLQVRDQYYRSLADHEIAIARLKEIAGTKP